MNKQFKLLPLLLALFVSVADAATDTFDGADATALNTHDAAWDPGATHDGLSGMVLNGSGQLTITGSNFGDAYYTSGTGPDSKSRAVFPAGVSIDALGNYYGVAIRMSGSQLGYQCLVNSSTGVNTNFDRLTCRCNNSNMATVSLSASIDLSAVDADVSMQMSGASTIAIIVNGTPYSIDLTNAGIVSDCGTVITGGYPGLFIYKNSGTPTQLINSWTDDAAAGNTGIILKRRKH